MSRPHVITIRQSPKNKQFYTTIKRGKIVFDGSEGHKRKTVADKAIAELINNIKTGNYKFKEELLKQAGTKPQTDKKKKKPKKTPAKKLTVRRVRIPSSMLDGATTLQ